MEDLVKREVEAAREEVRKNIADARLALQDAEKVPEQLERHLGHFLEAAKELQEKKLHEAAGHIFVGELHAQEAIQVHHVGLDFGSMRYHLNPWSYGNAGERVKVGRYRAVILLQPID